jgi:hypothetical protein
MNVSAVIALYTCVRERLPAVRLALIVTAVLSASPLLAQNAELSGLITDPSSLAVANARVVVESVDSGATRRVVSNQQGEFSVPATAGLIQHHG